MPYADDLLDAAQPSADDLLESVVPSADKLLKQSLRDQQQQIADHPGADFQVSRALGAIGEGIQTGFKKLNWAISAMPATVADVAEGWHQADPDEIPTERKTITRQTGSRRGTASDFKVGTTLNFPDLGAVEVVSSTENELAVKDDTGHVYRGSPGEWQVPVFAKRTVEEQMPGAEPGGFRNLKAWWKGASTSYQPTYAEISSSPEVQNDFWANVGAKVSRAGSDLLPRLYLMRGMGAVGVGPATAGAISFAPGEEGFSAKSAILGAAIPGVQQVGKVATGAVLSKLGGKALPAAAQKALEEMGGLAAIQTFNEAMSLPEKVKLYHENPQEFWHELAADTVVNLGFLGLSVPGWGKGAPSETAQSKVEAFNPGALIRSLQVQPAPKRGTPYVPNRGRWGGGETPDAAHGGQIELTPPEPTPMAPVILPQPTAQRDVLAEAQAEMERQRQQAHQEVVNTEAEIAAREAAHGREPTADVLLDAAEISSTPEDTKNVPAAIVAPSREAAPGASGPATPPEQSDLTTDRYVVEQPSPGVAHVRDTETGLLQLSVGELAGKPGSAARRAQAEADRLNQETETPSRKGANGFAPAEPLHPMVKAARDLMYERFRPDQIRGTPERPDKMTDHIERVAAMVGDDPHLKSIAYLHDIVEDTPTTHAEIRQMFGDRVADAIDAETWRKDHETYQEYIDRLSFNPDAIHSKLADIADNLAASQHWPQTPKVAGKQAGWRTAQEQLRARLQTDITPTIERPTMPDGRSRDDWRHEQMDKVAASASEPPPGHKPKLVFSGGGAGAGKSTIIGEERKPGGSIHSDIALTISADDFKVGDKSVATAGAQGIPEFSDLLKDGDPRAAMVAHKESTMMAKGTLARVVENGGDVIYDATMSDHTSDWPLAEDAMRQGYNVELIGVAIDPKIALARAKERAKKLGRYIPEDALLAGHAGFARAFPFYLEHFPEVDLWDNNGDRAAHLIVTKSREKGIEIHDPQAYVRFAGQAAY